MRKLLLIQSSPRGKSSVSRQLTAELLRRLRKTEELDITERDLSAHPLPHLQAEQLTAFYTPPEQRNEALREAVKLSDEAVGELLAADIVVISAPTWNFSMPSVLKAWIDHIVRAGLTFSYGENGVKGLAAGKKAYVVSASGNMLSSGPFQAMDFQEPYFRAVLGFIGIQDVTFLRAEGLGDPKEKDTAFAKAERSLEAALTRK